MWRNFRKPVWWGSAPMAAAAAEWPCPGDCGRVGCRRVFASPKSLAAHLKPPTPCPECGAPQRNLPRHLREVHRPRSLACPQCDYAAANPATLARHTATVHQGRKPFRCAECAGAFGAKRDLDRHAARAHAAGARPHRCAECPAAFATPKDLRDHQRYHRLPEHDCPVCRKAFSTSAIRNRHLREVHPE